MRRAKLLVLLGVLGVAACGEPRLHDLRAPGEGPDEFIVTPTLPLKEPESYSQLPAPTPGGNNVTDPQPLADSVAALGGRLGSPNGPIPAADAGIVSYAQRNGTAPDIRSVLAQEDAAFRKRRGRFSNIKLFPEDRYAQAYRPLALNPVAVAEAFRRAGIQTPKAPPSGRR